MIADSNEADKIVKSQLTIYEEIRTTHRIFQLRFYVPLIVLSAIGLFITIAIALDFSSNFWLLFDLIPLSFSIRKSYRNFRVLQWSAGYISEIETAGNNSLTMIGLATYVNQLNSALFLKRNFIANLDSKDSLRQISRIYRKTRVRLIILTIMIFAIANILSSVLSMDLNIISKINLFLVISLFLIIPIIHFILNLRMLPILDRWVNVFRGIEEWGASLQGDWLKNYEQTHPGGF